MFFPAPSARRPVRRQAGLTALPPICYTLPGVARRSLIGTPRDQPTCAPWAMISEPACSRRRACSA